MSVQKMEKEVETKRRKLNVSNVDEKSQKYLKQLKGRNLSDISFLDVCLSEL